MPDLDRLARRLPRPLAGVLASTWLWSVVLLALTWPVARLNAPVPGIDSSFFTALHMAAHRGFDYGTDIVATYGPLGFLRWPAVHYTWTTRLSIAYVLALQLLLCATLLWSVRRTFHAVVAFAIVLLAAGTLIRIGPYEVSVILVFAWAVEALRADGAPLARRWFPVAAGLLAGVEALVKLNTGLVVLVVAVLACLAMERGRRRSLGVFAAVFLVTAGACWFAAGQSAGNVGDLISAARSMISGWATAMMRTEADSAWERWAALAVVLLVLRCALEATSAEAARTRVGICVLWAVVAFATFKEGFIRQDVGHMSIFFATALGVALAFTWRRAQATTMLLSIAVLAMALFGAWRGDPAAPVTRAASNVRAIPATARVVLRQGERDRVIARDRRTLRAFYAIDPALLALVGRRSAQVLSSETNLVWAYDLNWRPVPVFEPQLALTTKLDDLNAAALSTGGSARIIRDSAPPLDGRNGAFDAPAMERALFCRYAELAHDRRWQVLGRIPTRCGRPTLLGTVRARWGEDVRVPRPRSARSAVYVCIDGVAPAGLERLRTLLYRARERRIVLDKVRFYRFVPGTAGDGTLISAPRGADYSPPFALAPNATTISIVKGGQVPPSTARLLGAPSPPPATGDARLTYAFYELPISRPGSARR